MICPICNSETKEENQEYCFVCAWEFEYFFDELDSEEKNKYLNRVKIHQSIYKKKLSLVSILLPIIMILIAGLSWYLIESNKVPLTKIEQLKNKCSDKDFQKCVELGILYEKGTGVAKDNAEAVKLYKKACDGNNARGCGKLGIMYQKGKVVTKNYKKAFSLFKKACDGNDANGCSWLGYMYENGQWATTNLSKAKKYYKKACDSGDNYGCERLNNL